MDHPVKALLVRPNGQSFCVQLDGEGLGSIKRVLGMENVDHDYGRHLGIYTFYDSKNSGPINVFPSFLMQGAYVGDVLIVGDLLIEVEDSDSPDEKIYRTVTRSSEFQDLPPAWFSPSLAELVQRANSDQKTIAMVKAKRPS